MRKLKFLSLLIIFLVLLFLLTDVYLLLLKPLDSGSEYRDNSGDILLVLGGGLKARNEIGVSTIERLDLAVKIYKRKRMKILVSDGSLYQKSPARKMFLDFFSENGVTDSDVIFEGRSQTTFENFSFTENLIKNDGRMETLVCTSPYHQRRSQNIIDYLNLKNYDVIRMGSSEIYQAGSIRQRIRNLKLIIREYVGLLKFKLFRK